MLPADPTTAPPTDAEARAAALREHPVCRRIKAAVLAVEPAAEVILFGSRARGDARPDSDWDVLVLLDGPIGLARDLAITQSLFRAFPPYTGVLVTAIARPSSHWSAPRKPTGFLRNIELDALEL